MRNPRTRKKFNAEFVVVDGNYVPLIGARAAQEVPLRAPPLLKSKY